MSKITWDDKVRIISVPGDRINQWRQEDANEVKDAINDIETRTVDLESGEGLIEIIDVSAEWTSDLIFDVTANNFPVLSTWYAATPDTITLDASDGTHPRFDLLTAIAPVSPATVGTVGKITGTPAASPARPDYDPSLVYPIKFVLVAALATEPSDTSTELVYDEDLGEATEWTATENTSGARIITDSTDEAFSGSKSIHFDSTTTSDFLTFTNATTVATSFINLFTFYIKLKEDYSNKFFQIIWYNSTTQMSRIYHFRDGKNGYDSSDLTWQKITIDGSIFRFSSGVIDNFTIRVIDGSLSGFYFDLFKIHEGSGSDNPNQWIEEAPIDGNPYARQDAQWTEISSVGEANTVSNQGIGGVGLFKQKAGLDFEFKNINAGSSKISVTNDAGNDEVDIDVVEANIALANINTSSLTYPTSDGNADDVIQTDGAGNLILAPVTAGSAESLHFHCRKSSAGTITKGTPCYFVSWNASGFVEIEAADANDVSKMPVIGFTLVDTTNSATVNLIESGLVENIVTNIWSNGDELWVSDDPSTTRGLTSTKPETVDDLIQKVAIVLRSHASQGVLLIIGAGRENDVPNIASNNFWLGSGAGAAVATDFDVEVAANSAVTANTAKNTNVGTALEIGTVGSTTVAITSDGSVDDVTLPAFATASTNAGLVTGSNSADNTNFLRADNSWAAPAGAGDMVLAGTQTVSGAKTFDAATLLLNDTDSAFDLELGSTSTITAANKTLTFDVNNANRTLTISGDATVTGSNTGDSPTALSVGTVTSTTVSITSDGSADDVTLPAATTTDAGMLTAALFDEIDANTAKSTNVSTDLSEGTSTNTTVDVNSSDGTNATLVSASTSRAGLLTKAKWDEIVANTSKTSNVTHTGQVTGATTLTLDKTAISGKGAVAMATDDRILIGDTSDSDNLKKAYLVEVLQMALGDEANDLTAGTDKLTFNMPNYATTLLYVIVYVTTAPTDSSIIVDLHEGGTTVMTTNKAVIDATETSSETAGTGHTLTDTALAANAIMTWDIDQIGSTVAGVGLKGIIIYTKS